jgi:7-carboxy-7-deazaguanine synthase (Cx14CxxC type)
MTFTVKAIFKTIQGEGYWAGSAAVFCRFAGCNLWSGREEDRANAICKFCDTEFRGGHKFPMCIFLAEAIEDKWGDSKRNRRVVFTGGEPGLQLTDGLIDALNDKLFATHVETNGTIELPPNVRWVTLSPKAGTELRQLDCNELKVAWPQDIDLEKLRNRLFEPAVCFLQPIDGPYLARNIATVVEYVKDHPWWRISTQIHKAIGVP